MQISPIPVFKPLIEIDEIEAATESLRQGWLGMGASVGAFEQALASLIGAEDRWVVAVGTGHAALHLALMLADIGPDDEVITPSFNNVADFQAILAVGAKPVLCDIDEKTLCIDVSKAEELISHRTRAIVPMDYGGCLADHDAVRALAESRGLRVIHDAAHSLGSCYKRRRVGSFSDITVFSFDPVKAITCIDGGALVVRSEAESERLHQMRLIGMGQPRSVMYGNQRAWTYDVSTLGFRYHMANLHAAIGLSQLGKFQRIESTRRAACRLYNERLRRIDALVTPQCDFVDVTPFLYYIRVPAALRQALREHLGSEGIDTGIHWQPGHWFSLLKNTRRGSLEVTDRVAGEILTLPLHSDMSPQIVELICDSVSRFFDAAAKPKRSVLL